MKKFISRSLLTRIVIYQIIIGIVPLLFLGIVSIIRMSNVLKDEAIEFQEENVRQGALYIDLIMDDVESLITNLSGIDEINNALDKSASETPYDKLTTQAKIGYILSGYTSLRGLVSIDIFSEYGVHYHVGETLNATNVNEDVLSALFNKTQESTGVVNWNGIEANINMDSEYSSVITATKLLTTNDADNDATENKGLLVVSYDPEILTEMFGQQYDSSIYTIVMDSRGRVIYSPNAQYIGKSVTDDLVSCFKANEKGYFTHRIDGENMLVIFGDTQKGGWTVARFIPLKNILSDAQAITVLFIILIIMSVTVTGVFGTLLSKQVIRPITQVTDTFRMLQSGDFRNVPRVEIINQDEIGELGKLFNSFIDAREDITTQKKLEHQLNQQNQELQETLQTLKAAQTQIIQQEKMAGIGQLAAGVAHEINNPLGFVKSNFSVLNKYFDRLENLFEAVEVIRQGKDDCKESKDWLNKVWNENSIDATRSDLKEIISDTQEGINRIAQIVNALKTFSRTSLIEEWGLYDINEGVRTTLLIANNEIKYNSNVKFSPTQVPQINANGGQINQVLLNVIVNAAQAIKQKQPSEKGLITIDTYVENDYVCCEIADNGCGMRDDVIKRIFEPFYTTKAVGQGTGLGLSLAYDIIVNKLNGKLEVNSKYGEGSRFRILIPIT